MLVVSLKHHQEGGAPPFTMVYTHRGAYSTAHEGAKGEQWLPKIAGGFYLSSIREMCQFMSIYSLFFITHKHTPNGAVRSNATCDKIDEIGLHERWPSFSFFLSGPPRLTFAWHAQLVGSSTYLLKIQVHDTLMFLRYNVKCGVETSYVANTLFKLDMMQTSL